MGFEFKLDESVAQSAGQGGALDTGVHTVVIEGAYLGQTSGGNNTLDLEVKSKDGGQATIYGICIDEKWKSGGKNYDYARWQELAAVVGMKTGATSNVKRKKFDGTEEDAVAFDELIGKTVQMAIQVELDEYNGKEKKKRKLNRTFFEDGKSIAEKQSGSEAKQSVKLAKSLKDYETKAYKAFKANGGASTGNNEPAGAAEGTISDEDLI